MPGILIVKTGTTEPQVVEQFGDYDDWFLHVLGPATVVAPFQGEGLPSPEAFGGVLLTGSPASVRDELPWMAELGRWAVKAAESVHVLGVCLGHQLIGEALGGWVAPNPLGGEMGTTQVELSAAGREDPLFEGLPPVLTVQQTHKDVLLRPPAAERLGSNANTVWQSFRRGRIRCVQFHPELPPGALRGLLRVRGLEGHVQDQDHGPAVLRNWRRLIS